MCKVDLLNVTVVLAFVGGFAYHADTAVQHHPPLRFLAHTPGTERPAIHLEPITTESFWLIVNTDLAICLALQQQPFTF